VTQTQKQDAAPAPHSDTRPPTGVEGAIACLITAFESLPMALGPDVRALVRAAHDALHPKEELPPAKTGKE
jgi:hypothetical protein